MRTRLSRSPGVGAIGGRRRRAHAHAGRGSRSSDRPGAKRRCAGSVRRRAQESGLVRKGLASVPDGRRSTRKVVAFPDFRGCGGKCAPARTGQMWFAGSSPESKRWESCGKPPGAGARRAKPILSMSWKETGKEATLRHRESSPQRRLSRRRCRRPKTGSCPRFSPE